MPGRSELPVALISLPDQANRRAACIERGMPADWVDNYWPATDMRGTELATAARLADIPGMESELGRSVTPAEVGCAASHRAVAAWLARSEYPMALVLEDDAVPVQGAFEVTVAQIAGLLANHAERGAAFICHLGPRREQTQHALSRPVRCEGVRMVQRLRLHTDPSRTLWRAHAYFLSREAAKRQVESEPELSVVADDWCAMRRRGYFDELFFTEVAVFAQDEIAESTIGGRRARPSEMPVVSPIARFRGLLSSDEPVHRLLAAAKHRIARADAAIRSLLPYSLGK